MSEYVVNQFKFEFFHHGGQAGRIRSMTYENLPASTIVFIRRVRPFLQEVFMIVVGNSGRGVVNRVYVGGNWVAYQGPLQLDTRFLYATAYAELSEASVDDRQSAAYQLPQLFVIRGGDNWVDYHLFQPQAEDAATRRLVSRRYFLHRGATVREA